jgi:hypothetical protein
MVVMVCGFGGAVVKGVDAGAASPVGLAGVFPVLGAV